MSSPAIGLRTIVADILCDQCQTPLIEIDLYGERLSGCTVCNKWGLPGDNHRVMELLEQDLAAVRQRVQQ
jgi:hypothetical protein